MRTFLSLCRTRQFWSVPVDQALKARPSFQLGMERPGCEEGPHGHEGLWAVSTQNGCLPLSEVV